MYKLEHVPLIVLVVVRVGGGGGLTNGWQKTDFVR